MPNMMQTGASWHGENLQVSAGRGVTIHHGDTSLTGITAVLSMHEHEVISDEGYLTRVLSHDWTFVADDLGEMVIGSGAWIVDSETGERYEALPIGNRPCNERKDSSGILITIHSKLVV